MATTEEEISAFKARILDLEKLIEDFKSRPQTPDLTAELKALREELSTVRKELADFKKAGNRQPDVRPDQDKADEDLEMGHFGGK